MSGLSREMIIHPGETLKEILEERTELKYKRQRLEEKKASRIKSIKNI